MGALDSCFNWLRCFAALLTYKDPAAAPAGLKDIFLSFLIGARALGVWLLGEIGNGPWLSSCCRVCGFDGVGVSKFGL